VNVYVANQCQVGLWRSLEQVGDLEQSGAAARSPWRCCIWVLYGLSPAAKAVRLDPAI
jgi:hypothetical protein